ncbi:MAG: Ig-like domain-containing protein [Cellvibrionaceae bacterium]
MIWFRLMCAGTALTLLAACGLEGDSSTPRLTAVTPSENSTDVATDTAVTVTFNETLFADTLTSNSLTLFMGSTPVAGDLGYDATTNSLVFTPSNPLPLATTFTVTYGEGITDLARNPVSTGQTNFTTLDGIWQPTASLSTTLSNANSPSVAIDDNGYGVAIWIESDSFYEAVHAAHYVPGTGWNAPGIIDVFSFGDATSPTLELNKNTGQVLVTWIEDNAGTAELWATLYDPSIGWGTPQKITDSTDNVSGAATSYLSASGIATVVWTEINATVNQVWGNQYNPSSGWGTPTLIQQDAAENGQSPILSGNSNDQLALIWQQSNAGSQFNVYFSEFLPASGWSAPTEIDATTENSIRGDVDINDNGQIIAFWSQIAGTNGDAYFSSYDSASGWSTPSLVIPGNGEVVGVSRVMLAADGNAQVFYGVGGVGTGFELFTATYASGQWEAPIVIAQEAGKDVLQLSINSNQFGVIQTSWIEVQGQANTATESFIRQRRYRPGVGWEAAETLHGVAGELSTLSRIALAPSGESLLVWKQQDAATNTTILRRVFSQ